VQELAREPARRPLTTRRRKAIERRRLADRRVDIIARISAIVAARVSDINYRAVTSPDAITAAEAAL